MLWAFLNPTKLMKLTLQALPHIVLTPLGNPAAHEVQRLIKGQTAL